MPRKIDEEKYYKKVIKENKQLLANIRYAVSLIVDKTIIELEKPEFNIADTVNFSAKDNVQDVPQNVPFCTGISAENVPNCTGNTPEITGESEENQQLNSAEKLSGKDPAKNLRNDRKASYLEMLHKLGKLMLKLIPLEVHLAKLDIARMEADKLREKAEKAGLPQDEVEMLNEYIHRYIADDMKILDKFIQPYIAEKGWKIVGDEWAADPELKPSEDNAQYGDSADEI